MKKLVNKVNGTYKTNCSNCTKHYMCSGPQECINVLLERLYMYENELVPEHDFEIGDRVKVCRWDELRERCWHDYDSYLEFFEGPIYDFYETDSYLCELEGTIYKLDEDNVDIFYIDTAKDKKLCTNFVKRL